LPRTSSIFSMMTVITAATSEGARAKLQYYRSYVSAEEALGGGCRGRGWLVIIGSIMWCCVGSIRLAGGSERAVTPQPPP
jgi:hypothetical protein